MITMLKGIASASIIYGFRHLQFNWNTLHGLGAKHPLRYSVTVGHINLICGNCISLLCSVSVSLCTNLQPGEMSMGREGI